ncbi:MAG: DUF4337 domain-containing protein [Pseudomonadota bacterium]
MEPNEVTEQLALDKASEGWLNYLAVTTIILAVFATLAGFKEGNNSVDSVLNQTQAANQWSYYQAKSIKSYLYEMQKDKLEMELKARKKEISPELIAEYEGKISTYGKDIERYSKERKDIMVEAKKYENLRDDVQRRAQAFGISMVFLQMGILLSSIAALMKKKPLWYAGLVIGVVGSACFVDGFVLIMN